MDNLRDFPSKTGISAGTASDAARLGPYRIEQELGRGFSSVVYQALDTGRGRRVALKVLSFLPSQDEDRRADLAERFSREARAISALSHPNVVAIYDVGQADDGRQFIAMERLAGETLRRRLQRDGRMPVPQAVAAAVRIAEALHYAHGRGVVHRDVKPDNVFLCSGEGEAAVVPKLMDFGIAHVLSDQSLTRDGTIVGSPAYMSPEQINGHAVDARTDVFSLAVTLTEMVAGAKPFDAETVPAVMQRILHHAPDLKGVPDDALRRVLARALSKSPHARYPDAEGFALALRQAVPLVGLPATIATQILVDAPPARKFMLAGRMPSAAALGLGGLALATLAVLPLLAPRPTPQRLAARPPSMPQPLLPGRIRRIAAAWQPARSSEPNPIAWHVIEKAAMPVVRVRPAVTAQAAPLVPAAAPSAKNSPPAKNPPPRVSPLPAAKPIHPRARPALASVLTGLETSPATPPPPIVRVAASRQEMTLETKPAPAAPAVERDVEPEAPADVPPAPRAAGLADAGPRAVHRMTPRLPDGVHAQEASVRVRVSVDEDGAVTDAVVLRSSGDPALDRAALDCVRQWEYDPAIRDGQSVPGETTEQVKFTAR